MQVSEYHMPAKLTFRKETTNEGEVLLNVCVEAADNDGSRYSLNVTKCEDAERLLPVFEEGLKKLEERRGRKA